MAPGQRLSPECERDSAGADRAKFHAPLLSFGRSMRTTPARHLPIATPLSLSDRGGNRRMSHVSLRRASVGAPQPVARAPQDLGGHPDDELAEVAPLQHSDESAWRVFETVDDVLAVANATRGDARTNLAQEVGIVFGREVVVDEAAHRQALGENLPHGRGEPIRTVARWDAVVLRNEPGDRNAGKIVEQRQHGFPDGSADVLEVDVDALRTYRGQSRRKIGGAMINHGVEAKLVLHEGAFLGTASNADRPRPGELRELADERPDRPARRGDDDGFVGLRLAEPPQPALRGEPRQTEHAHAGRARGRGPTEVRK